MSKRGKLVLSGKMTQLRFEDGILTYVGTNGYVNDMDLGTN